MNFFEQQARQDQRMANVLRELLGVDNAVRTIEKASPLECRKMFIALSERMRVFEENAVNSTAESDYEEAKRQAMYAANNIFGAMQEEPEEPHEPGCKCDRCRAAASDVANDKFVDAQLLKGK